MFDLQGEFGDVSKGVYVYHTIPYVQSQSITLASLPLFSKWRKISI